MKILVVLFVFILSESFAIEAQKNRVRVIPQIPKKDWLEPQEGILVTQHTPVYLLEWGPNGQILSNEIPKVIENVAADLLQDGNDAEANVDNIANSNDHLISQWPEVIYPRVMVVIANDLYRKILGDELEDVVTYILAFWNGVDMMFRSITNPKIRFHIAGIILEGESEMLDYLRTDFRFFKDISSNAIFHARKFWYKHHDKIHLESYDNIVTMTSRKLCADRVDVCDHLVEGRSVTGSMCAEASTQKVTDKVIIIQDNASFSGIPTAAHELGHSFGIEHDGDEKFTSDEELKKFLNCKNVSSGHIMDDYLSASFHERRWSQCSLDQLTKLIEEKKLTCLYDAPISSQNQKNMIYVPRLLPGEFASLDDQCRGHGYVQACLPQSEVCKYLECEKEDDYEYCYQLETFTAADGTPCDEDDLTKFCMFGRCVSAAAFE